MRQIAKREYEDNMPRLAESAAKIASERAEDLVKKLLLALPENDSKVIASFKEPDMHLTLLEAQMGYARSGDANLEQVLIDLLVRRALEEQNSEKSMILSESIKVVPKLTTTHLDSLTIILLLTRTNLGGFMESHNLATQLETMLAPFLKNISLDASSYEYLNYTGCGSIMRVARWPPMHEIFSVQFPEIFKEKSPNEIRDHVLLLYHPLAILFDEWSTRTISRFDFNAVGVAIAQANFRNKTGKTLKDSLPRVKAKVSD